jgi:hypothetical protein
MPTDTRPSSRRLRALLSGAALACALAAAGPALAAGVAPAHATPVQREQAQGRFVKGKDLYAHKKYDAALVEFNASLDIVASPNTRLYVARCLREMDKTVAAYVGFGRTAVEAKELARDDPRYLKTAEAADDERRQLEPKLGFIEVDVANAAPETTLRVGGDEVRRGGWSEPIPVTPGATTVVVETPGHAPIERPVELAAGERRSVAIDAAASAPAIAASGDATDASAAAPADAGPSSRARLRPWAYVAGGVAVAGLATFAFFGLKSNATYDDLKSACPDGPCPPGHESDISAGRTQQTVANIGLVVGAVGAVAGVTLFVLSAKHDKPASSAALSSSRGARAVAPLAPVARVTIGPSFAGLEGAF